MGILAAPAIAGSDLQGLGLSVAFFALAMVTQAAYVGLFRTLTTYDDSEQIQGENLAAAVSYAGISVAIVPRAGPRPRPAETSSAGARPSPATPGSRPPCWSCTRSASSSSRA